MYLGLQLNADTLTSLGAQPPQEDMQPLNHQYSSKNNQGMKVIVFLLLHFHSSLAWMCCLCLYIDVVSRLSLRLSECAASIGLFLRL